MLTIEIPDIPHDALAENDFWSTLKSRVSTIDKSAEDHLTAWIDIPYTLLGGHEEVHRKLHENSQGLVKLDRHLCNKIYEKAKNHPVFGIRFKSYIERCHKLNRSGRGRVLLSMIAQRFRLDRARGNTITMLQLYKLKLQGYKKSDVQIFVNKVRFMLQNLRDDEVKDKKMLYQWLYEQFKDWHAIEREMGQIRRSNWDSTKRSFKFLWSAINSWLDHSNEDQNIAVTMAAANAGKVPGMVVNAKGPKTAAQKAQAKAKRQANRAAAAAAKYQQKLDGAGWQQPPAGGVVQGLVLGTAQNPDFSQLNKGDLGKLHAAIANYKKNWKKGKGKGDKGKGKKVEAKEATEKEVGVKARKARAKEKEIKEKEKETKEKEKEKETKAKAKENGTVRRHLIKPYSP